MHQILPLFDFPTNQRVNHSTNVAVWTYDATGRSQLLEKVPDPAHMVWNCNAPQRWSQRDVRFIPMTSIPIVIMLPMIKMKFRILLFTCILLGACSQFPSNKLLLLDVYNTVQIGDSLRDVQMILVKAGAKSGFKTTHQDESLFYEGPFQIGDDWRGVEITFSNSKVIDVQIISWDKSNESPHGAPPRKGGQRSTSTLGAEETDKN